MYQRTVAACCVQCVHSTVARLHLGLELAQCSKVTGLSTCWQLDQCRHRDWKGKGEGWIPLGRQCSSSSSDQTEGKSEKGRDSPSSFPSLALDPLSPTQLCKLRRSGADADCSRVRLLCSCAAKSGTERCCSGPVRQSVRLCGKLVVLLWRVQSTCWTSTETAFQPRLP